MSAGSGDPGRGRASPRAWLEGGAALIGSFAVYFLLPLLAPVELAGEIEILLLGILNGLTVAAALRLPARLTPAIAVGATLGAILRFGLDDQLEPFVVVVALVIGAQVWAFAWLLRRQGVWLLRDTSDLLRYGLIVLSVTLVGGLLVSLAGLTDVHLPADDFLHAWRSWVIDDLFGLVVIAPAILTLHRPRGWTWSRAGEYLVAVAYTAAATYYMWFVVEPGRNGLFGWPYLVTLGGLWIAVRLGVQAVAPVLALQYWVAVVATVNGRGAFSASAPDPLDRLLTVELFAIIMTTATLALATLRDARLRAQEERARTSRLMSEVINGADALVFAKSYEGPDADRGRYVVANQTWSEVTGVAVEDTIGRSDLDLWPEERARAFIDADQAVIAADASIEVNEENLDAEGRPRQYLSSKFPLRRPDGGIWGVGGIATDITDVQAARRREEQQAQLLHAVFELSPTPAVRLTMKEGEGIHVQAANAAMCSLIGAAPGAVDDCDLMDHILPADAGTAVDLLAYARSTPASGLTSALRQREVRMRTLDGRTVWVLMSAAAVRGFDDIGTEIVAQFEDFTARREAELALTDQAMRDAVTGLPNRRALQERIEASLQRLRRHPGMVTVLFCDLDHFKDVNDSLGHAVGDQLLVEVAERMKSAVRPEDTVARLGGDEFVVFGEGMNEPEDATIMALRLQDRLSAPWVLDDRVFRPEMSIGITMTADPTVTVDELLRRADLAMYRAKEQGRNRVEVYERAVDDEVQHAVAMQHELRRAIDTDGLVLYYQPIVRLSDRAVVAMESLVRMRGRDGGIIGPGEFVPQAEATGLVIPLGAWVIQRALADLPRLHHDSHDAVLSINVSPTQLREPGFAEFLLGRIAQSGVSPHCLSVEVTETALIHDPGRSREELAALNEAGVRIALDDFGTGFSSLSWLTQFPVDVVKIDKSFTDDVGLDERKTAIITAVIAVSHELGFTVVAEGVETEEQAARLIDLGCDRGQGYLFGRPVPLDEVTWT